MRSNITSLAIAAIAVLAYIRGASADIEDDSSRRGGLTWAQATAKAKAAVSGLTTAELATVVSGIGWQQGPCVGNTAGVSKIAGFNGLCLQDGPAGVRFGNGTSVFPSGINVAATFNKQLMLEHGVAMGEEFRGKGVNVWLGPVLNFARTPQGGRNWEGAGADPYLVAVASSLQVKGAQSVGVIATVKHYIGNEQEHGRNNGNTNMDDRTLRELYGYPFLASIQAGAGAAMCSYNKFNGTYACVNSRLFQILKQDLGFNGFIMSDWWATADPVNSANNGLDVMMPGDAFCCGGPPQSPILWGNNLATLVENKNVSSSRLTDMATRVISSWYKMGQDKNYPVVTLKDASVNVQKNHAAHIRQVGAESSVLLKNSGVLPLKEGLKSIAIVGEDSGRGRGPNAFSDRGGVSGTVAIGWGSGTADFPYIVTPQEGITAKASKFGISGSSIRVANTNDTDLNAAKTAATGADVAVVFVYSNSGEGYITVQGNAGDRNDLKLWNGGDDLVNAVASVNKNTVVVIHGPGAVDMPWINNPNIKAVIMALYPGQETGNAISDVLFGSVNPSGRLPFTIGADRTQYCCEVIYSDTAEVTYTEGLFIDYMWNDLKGIKPVFWFGHGLSYTTFAYSNLRVIPGAGQTLNAAVVVTNTGNVEGQEVAQLYLGFPSGLGEPLKKLRGFEKVNVRPRASAVATFFLSKQDLSIWDVKTQKWVVPNGTFTVYVGASAGDIRQKATFKVSKY
ncbi:glycoside hydrolase superfamily [Cladochytrium replicatum]|nr:glycoside hydrolase superfamily [Cladochytrium replicatum]